MNKRGKLIRGVNIVFLLVIFILFSQCALGWYDNNWDYRKPVIILSSKVGADLTNFSVLIDITDSDLSSKALSSGDDILFTDSFENKIPHEIELYESGAGHLVAWVKADLSSSVNTIIYMYYGNSGASDQQDVENVWDSNFIMVQHLNETSGTHYDSTSNNNDGTQSGGVTQDATGKIDGADDFDGIDNYVNVPADSSHNLFNNLTISMWIKPDQTYDSSSTEHVVLLNRQQPEGDDSFVFMINQQDGTLHLGSYGGNIRSTQNSWQADTWYHIAVTYRSDLSGEIYVNGVEEVLSVDNYDSMASVIRNIEIGGAPGYQEFFDGVIDEVRLSNITRSADWVNTSYENQNNPNTFYSLGSEESSIYTPIVSNPLPANEATNVSISLSELNFTLSDPQDDLIDYNVTMTPDVIGGVQTGTGISSGTTIHIPITGCPLEYNTVYTWQVNATDPAGSGNWNNVTYTFTTEMGEMHLSDWGYRDTLTIDHENVAGDLTDFPILIDITHDGLKDYAQIDGDDILFTNSSANWATDNVSVRLDHEIELYDSNNGHLVAWVKVPFLSSTTDTILYMYYGNDSVTESQENVEAVWDSNYKLVQHLKETSGTHYDSTSNDNDGTPYVTTQGSATGKIDGADGFDGADDYIHILDSDSLDITGDLTITAWVYPDSFAERNEVVCKVYYDDAYIREFEVRLWRVTSSTANVRFLAGSGVAQNNDFLFDGLVPVDEWSLITIARNSTSAALYINGVFDSARSLVASAAATTADVCIGRRCPPNDIFPFDGIIDEVHISNTARSPEWILTKYNNQNSPSTFCIVGDPPDVTLISPADESTVGNPVNFTYIPQCFSDGCSKAELYFNATVYSGEGTLEWSNANLIDMDRAVLRDYKAYGIHWPVGGGPCDIAVFNFTTGAVIYQSAQFGATNPSTAPTLDPNEPEIVYGFSGDGHVVKYNVTSDSFEWQTDISGTSSRVLWPLSVPYYNGYLYISFINGRVYQINTSDGGVVRYVDFDDGTAEMQIPPRVDNEEGVLYMQDATALHKLYANNMSEIWNVPTGSNCLYVTSSLAYSSRFTPLLVNDSFTDNNKLIITECTNEDRLYAFDSSGNQIWNKTLETRARAMPNYHPDRGWIYLNRFVTPGTGIGRVYVINITDGSDIFNFTYPNSYPSNRPMMLTKKYLISKTDRGSGVLDYLYVFNNTNGSLVGTVAMDTQRYHCDPLITSAGYTLITHAYGEAAKLWKLGSGEYSDYNPYTGANGYQYTENGLTHYGQSTEVWSSQATNQTSIINNTVNGIMFDFSDYSLPETFRWNIKVTDSNGYSSFADDGWVVTVQVLPSYDKPLSTGWNLISIPLNVTNKTLPYVLASIAGNYGKVFAYDSEWKMYDPNDLVNSNLASIEDTIGSWIKMTSADTLTVQGTEFTTVNFNLKTGYNLISYPSLNDNTVGYVFGDVISDVENVLTYENNSWRSYNPNKVEHNTLTTVKSGQGYWVNVNNDVSWSFDEKFS